MSGAWRYSLNRRAYQCAFACVRLLGGMRYVPNGCAVRVAVKVSMP